MRQEHYTHDCLELPQFCFFCKQTFVLKKMQVHLQLDCPSFPAQCTKCNSIFIRSQGHLCATELSLQEVLRRTQAEALQFELQFRQQMAKCDNLASRLKESCDTNVRLREAVEELERRLQTNYDNNAAIQDAEDDDFGGENRGLATSGPQAGQGSNIEMFAELEAIDNIGDMRYHEKHAFNLEHLSGITCLIQIRMSTNQPLPDMSKHLGEVQTMADQDEAEGGAVQK